ncbi:MAG: hypothetical protein ACOH2I_13455 [Pseudomonas sp.]
MLRRSTLSLSLLLLSLALWFAASYGLRYGLMEDSQWVQACVSDAQRWECQLRDGLGWLIHLRILAWAALGTALLASIIPAHWGWRLALLALLFGVPALVLYSASLAVFAVLIAGLRLVRAPTATH